MLVAAIAALIGSAAVAYLVGYTLAAPRDAFMRKKRGTLVLVVLALTFIPLPPQLPALGEAAGPLRSVAGDLGSAFMWPEALGPGVYIALWIVTTLIGFLAGIRIWQLGTADWRSGAGRAVDSSAASRVIGLVPLADCIEDALDVVKRVGLSEREVPRAAEAIRAVGRRFADSLPPSDGEVFRLVVARVPPAIAGAVTGLLLEGAGRRTTRG